VFDQIPRQRQETHFGNTAQSPAVIQHQQRQLLPRIGRADPYDEPMALEPTPQFR
jgi:hypothetical protein